MRLSEGVTEPDVVTVKDVESSREWLAEDDAEPESEAVAATDIERLREGLGVALFLYLYVGVTTSEWLNELDADATFDPDCDMVFASVSCDENTADFDFDGTCVTLTARTLTSIL